MSAERQRVPAGASSPHAPRTFLFLQGLASPFFARLGAELRARGHRVVRINISLGDALFWMRPATNFRGSLAGWRKYLGRHLADNQVTDIILFGDCRPYHRVAISLAAHRRVQVHVLEEGYLRPFWMTVERGGVNGYSTLPRSPETIMALAAETPEPHVEIFDGSFALRAVWDVLYNIANIAGRPIYPWYRRHRPNHVLVEYAGWLKRFVTKTRTEADAEGKVAATLAHPGGFFLIPLQLDSDYQIRVHSRFGELAEFLDEAFTSFALHAPPDAKLLVKVHPLDNGLIDRRRQVAALAARHGIADRVVSIDGGHLPTLLERSRGVVVVNSTVGMSSIEVGRPTIALGASIYNLPGLAWQGGLDRFWTEAGPPDIHLTLCFRKLVMARTQVNGGFFSRRGLDLAVANAADRLEAAEPLKTFPAGGAGPAEPALPAGAALMGRPVPAE